MCLSDDDTARCVGIQTGASGPDRTAPDYPSSHLQATAKNGGGSGASAAKGGGGGSGASAAKQPPAPPLSPEEFEALVVRLEGLMQEAVSQESVGWQANGELTGWC